MSRDDVASNQRERIMNALVATVGAYGYSGCTVERIAARAGVSRRTFYEQFDSREDAYLHAYDRAASCLLEQVAEASADADGGPAQLRAGLQALLERIAAEPRLARMCIIEVLAVGPQALERRDKHMQTLSSLLESTVVAHSGTAPPPLASDGLAAAIYDVVYKRVAREAAEELPELLDDLHSFCLMLFRYSPVPEAR